MSGRPKLNSCRSSSICHWFLNSLLAHSFIKLSLLRTYYLCDLIGGRFIKTPSARFTFPFHFLRKVNECHLCNGKFKRVLVIFFYSCIVNNNMKTYSVLNGFLQQEFAGWQTSLQWTYLVCNDDVTTIR